MATLGYKSGRIHFFWPDCSQCTFSGFELEDDMSKNCDEGGLCVVEICRGMLHTIFLNQTKLVYTVWLG